MNSEEKFYTDLGANIASKRNEQKINQDTLADFLKLSRPSVVNIEKGRQKPNILTLALIANYLKTSVENLIPAINDLDINELVLRGVDSKDQTTEESINNFLQSLRNKK